MRGCEVIQYGQAFTEVSLNWHFYGLTGCIGNQTTHTSQLTNLVVVTTGTRLCHHGQRVELTHAALHGCAYVVSSLGPDFNNLSVSFIIGNEAASEVCLNTGYLLISFCQNLILFRRYSNVVDTDGNTGYECEMEAQCLYVIQQFCGFGKAQFLEGIVDELAHLLLADGDTQCFLSIRTLVVEAHWFLEDKVENQTTRGSHNEAMAWDIYLDEVMNLKLLQGISQHNFVIAGVAVKLGHIHGVFFCLALFNNGKVVSAQNHFLRRNSYRLAVLGGQNVVDGEHKGSGFGLCFYGQRQMACHLVAIEVGVVAWAYQRVQLDCTAFPQY